MNLEIERRFLVDIKRLPKLSRGKIQTQGYFNPPEVDGPEVRIRLEEDEKNSLLQKSFLTLKFNVTRKVRKEFEYQIPVTDAKHLLSIADKKIKKTRYKTKVDGHVWVIDFFQEENSPLVLAEIELEDEKSNFIKPLWCLKEVTNDLSFTAFSLAYNPISSWRKSRKKS